MNTKHIFNSLGFAAATLVVAACADTDAQYTIPEATAPTLVSVTPDNSGILRAQHDTLRLTFDQNVFFYTGNSSQITLNGQAVDKAYVSGSDKVLNIVVDIPAAESITLHIPAGIVLGPQKTPIEELNLTWQGRSISITSYLANGNATAEAQALYNLLLNNYGSKTLSAVMTSGVWDTQRTEEIYTLTGKYPVFSGFDYMHLPFLGENWVPDYNDITPISDWTGKGGKVMMMWHWNVPNYPLAVDVTEIPGDWSGSIQVTDEQALATLAGAQAGDQIVVRYKNASGAQGSIKDSGWAGIVDESGTSYEYFDIGTSWTKYGNAVITEGSYTLTLDASSAETVKSGFIVSGHDYTVTAINYVKQNGDEQHFYCNDESTFRPANVLTEGTLENRIVKRDLADIASRLKALQDAGISVVWRPMHEASGNVENYVGGKPWFWWGELGAEGYKQLWHMMFEYFQTEGVNNLIWVWTGADNDANWYPGDEYVDIIAADIYNKDASAITTQFNNMQALYPNKMITLGECGGVPAIGDLFTAGAQWSYFMPWNGSGDNGEHASDEWWKAAMESSSVLTLDDVK